MGPGWWLIENVPVAGPYLALLIPLIGGFLIVHAGALLAPSYKILIASLLVPIVSFAPFFVISMMLLLSDHSRPGEVAGVLWLSNGRFMLAAAIGAVIAVAVQAWRTRQM